MEAKKNPAKDVHRFSKLFFIVGLIISISLVICAFEWTSQRPAPVVGKFDNPDETILLVEPPPTQIHPPSKPNLPSLSVKIIAVVSADLPEEPAIGEIDLSQDERQPYPVFIPEPEPEDTTFIYVFAEKQPEPVGGYSNFYHFISREIKYPSKARNANVEGKVFVQFVINHNGEPGDFRVIKGIGFGCDEESIRVIEKTRWNPGKQRGKPVRVRMVLPVIFKMN